MNDSFSEIINQANTCLAHLPPAIPGCLPETRDLSRWIDHTLLKAEATPGQVERLCAEAAEYHFATVCINPIYVPLAASKLANSGVEVCTVVGFPLGATHTSIKTGETRFCIEHGAAEIDMVIPIGLLKGNEPQRVLEDIQAVVETAHPENARVKVILEMAYLNQYEKILGCLLSQAAGADFVKTSTGFGPSGATVEDVTLMHRVVGKEMGVKAAGGIRSLEQAQVMILAGANRLGSSSGVAILREAKEREIIHQ